MELRVQKNKWQVFSNFKNRENWAFTYVIWKKEHVENNRWHYRSVRTSFSLFYCISNLIYPKLLRGICRKTVRFILGQKFLRLPEIAGIISIPWSASAGSVDNEKPSPPNPRPQFTICQSEGGLSSAPICIHIVDHLGCHDKTRFPLPSREKKRGKNGNWLLSSLIFGGRNRAGPPRAPYTYSTFLRSRAHIRLIMK